MSADVINLNSILKPMEELREHDPCCQLHYHATPAEYHNKRWREWFAEHYPTVILHLREPIPK